MPHLPAPFAKHVRLAFRPVIMTCGLAALCLPLFAAPVKVIFDTDMETDCDDAGAMAVLHALADRGECEILATVTSVRDVNSIATVDAINRYRGRPELPLGMVKGAGVLEPSKFAAKIAKEFPHGVKSAESVADAVTVYRDVLEAQADHSVVVVTVGYLTNLKGLLQLPAGDGHGSGLELIKTKVAQWVCMGGNFIGDPPKDDLKLGNVNFQRDATSAHYVIHQWPGEIIFAGREVCSVPSGLQLGEALANTSASNPVRRAYEHYFGGKAKNRHVADLATVLYAVRGLTDCWDISEPGRMDLKPDMKFDWQPGTDGRQRYLLKKADNDRHVEAVLNDLMISAPKTVGAKPPYPPSPVIAGMDWAPKESIRRAAQDGDNWPVTWADDDALYTTWGDGTGFVPKVKDKLSLGFARITGSPEGFSGVNVRSEAEQMGQGRSGKKGWGALGVDGVLYLWLGHADNKGGMTQLAWSKDHAKTWTFADWKFAEFGMTGFVNFGRNYAGARDDHVYAYSHDGSQADTPADRFILMRAPKDKPTLREAWEFFVKRDAQAQPLWSPDIKQRGSVFEHRDACLRSAMTYCAPLKRYLWWQHVPQVPGVTNDRGDTRYHGGFAIYDAPKPWGPWTTAYFTDFWDTGPGEHGDFPAKWMSADGLTLHLVFSGDDAFCVRQAKVRLR